MRTWLRRIGVSVAVLAGLAGIAAAAVWVRSELVVRHRHPVSGASVPIPAGPAAVAEGRRLATVYGCFNGCHGRDGGGTLFFDMPAIARLVAPNLSTAVRRYSDDQLVEIIRNGVRPDGRSVFVMPSQAFHHLTDADVGLIVASLRTIPLMEGPEPSLSLGPAGRLGIATGKFRTAAQLIADDVPPPPARTTLGKHGRYLATSICSECHGSNLGGDQTPDFVAPALAIVAAYSREDFRRLMRTGAPIGGRTLGLMRVRAQQNFTHLTDAEIDALYEYLRGLAAG